MTRWKRRLINKKLTYNEARVPRKSEREFTLTTSYNPTYTIEPPIRPEVKPLFHFKRETPNHTRHVNHPFLDIKAVRVWEFQTGASIVVPASSFEVALIIINAHLYPHLYSYRFGEDPNWNDFNFVDVYWDRRFETENGYTLLRSHHIFLNDWYVFVNDISFQNGTTNRFQGVELDKKPFTSGLSVYAPSGTPLGGEFVEYYAR